MRQERMPMSPMSRSSKGNAEAEWSVGLVDNQQMRRQTCDRKERFPRPTDSLRLAHQLHSKDSSSPNDLVGEMMFIHSAGLKATRSSCRKEKRGFCQEPSRPLGLGAHGGSRCTIDGGQQSRSRWTATEGRIHSTKPTRTYIISPD